MIGVQGAVQIVGRHSAGAAAFGFDLDSCVADAVVIMQTLADQSDDGLTFADRAVARQDNVAA